jgi:hypothetical protein
MTLCPLKGKADIDNILESNSPPHVIYFERKALSAPKK